MYSTSGRMSPVTLQLVTSWDDASKEEQQLCIRKATEACKIVCGAIAPHSGDKLFNALFQAHKKDICAELEPLLKAYKSAQSNELKTQILSIYVHSYPANTLMEIHRKYESITEWQLRKARLHARVHGPGAPLEKPLQHRIRLDMKKCDHFLEFVNRPYFHQDVSYGIRTLRLDSGDKLVMPNVVRCVARSTMIAQYLQHCEEDTFEPLSRATLYRILEVREASQQKALQGLDNTAADGTAAFETLVKIIDNIERSGDESYWAIDLKTKLSESKCYLKTNYKVHCKEESSPCADHCRFYSLSDPTCKEFFRNCDHAHDMRCDQCNQLTKVLSDIEERVRKQENSSFFSKEQQEDLLYDFYEARQDIWEWKAHVMRSENQERAKQEAIKIIDKSTALVTMDWAMKFQCQKYREKQSEWFGKRGLSWHVSSVLLKDPDTDDVVVHTYVHLFDSCSQDWFTVVSVLEDLLEQLKKRHPQLQKVYLKSDEAGCYHNTFTLISINTIGKRVGIRIQGYDYSEPNHGKDICDRIICPMKSSIRRYCDEGHDIESAAAMREALYKKPVKGVTAAVCSVNEQRRSLNAKKIPQISTYHSFRYEEDGIRVWKAYSVGPGKLIKFGSLLKCSQGPTALSVADNQEFFPISLKTVNRKQKNKESGEDSCTLSKKEQFPCNEPGCPAVFSTFSALEEHLNKADHGKTVTNESLYDKIRREWAAQNVTMHSDPTHKNIAVSHKNPQQTSAAEKPTLSVGWALSKPRAAPQKYSDKVKEYLTSKFNAGEATGRKADPQRVSKDMRNARSEDNVRIFKREEWLTRGQVQSFFSRLAALKRKGDTFGSKLQAEVTTEPLEEWEKEVKSAEEERLNRNIRREICNEIATQHPIFFDNYNLCELAKAQELNKFTNDMLKRICQHFEIQFKARTRKIDLLEKVRLMVKECTCVVGC